MAVEIPGLAQSLPIARPSTAVANADVSQVGRAMAQGGAQLAASADELHRAYQDEQLRIDKTRTEDAFTELRNRQLDLTLGEEEGFTNIKGGDAVKQPILKDWGSKFDQSVEDIAGRLGNERQREAFRLRSGVARTQFNQDILQHLQRENGQYQKNVMESTLDVETRNAGMRWNNPNEVNASIARSQAAVKAYADANGYHQKEQLISQDARYGELGAIKNKDGSVSTEYSVTVNVPELGGWVNIPSLVKGQKNVDAMLENHHVTDAQTEVAIKRAIERVKGGAALPSFDTLEQAEKAAKSRSEKEKMAPYQMDVVGGQMAFKATSAIHTAVINEAIANKNPAYAKLYYDTHKDKIDPGTGVKLQGMIAESSLRSDAQQKTDEYMQLDPKAAMEKARGIKDPELRDEVVRRVKSQINENNALQNQVESEAVSSAFKMAVDGAKRDDIPEQVWSDMTGQARVQVTNYMNSTKRGESDIGAYYQMKGLMARDPDGALKFLFKNSHLFTNSDNKGFIDDLTAIPKPDNVLANKAALDNTASQLLGPKPSSSNATAQKAWIQRYDILLGIFQEKLNDWHEKYPQAKTIPDEERRKILDELQVKATRKEGLFGIDMLWPDKTQSLADIPPDDLRGIRAALEAQGQPVTAESILTVYMSAP